MPAPLPPDTSFSNEMDATSGTLLISGIFSAFGTCPSDQKETPNLPSHLCQIPTECLTHSEDRSCRLGLPQKCPPLSEHVLCSRVRPRRSLLSCSSAVPGVWPGLSHRVLLWRGKRRRRPRGRQSPACAPVRVPRRSRACHS